MGNEAADARIVRLYTESVAAGPWRVAATLREDGDAARLWGVWSELSVFDECPGDVPVGGPRLVVSSAIPSGAEAALPAWHPSWKPEFLQGLARWRGRLRGRVGELLIVPRAGDVVSDTPSILTLARGLSDASGAPGEPAVGVVLDIAALLTPELLSRAEDHLDRWSEAFAGLTGLRAVMVRNVEAVPEQPGGLRSVPLSRGAVKPELLVRAARRIARGTPLVVDAGEVV